MEFDGVRWSLVDIGGVWWSLVEFGGVWWSLVEIGGVWWSLVEFDSTQVLCCKNTPRVATSIITSSMKHET